MNNRQSNLFLFIGGAIAGAAAAYLYNTPKGKAFRENVSETGEKIKDELISKANQAADQIKSTGKRTMNAATESILEFNEEFDDVSEDALALAEDKIDRIKKEFDAPEKRWIWPELMVRFKV